MGFTFNIQKTFTKKFGLKRDCGYQNVNMTHDIFIMDDLLQQPIYRAKIVFLTFQYFII